MTHAVACLPEGPTGPGAGPGPGPGPGIGPGTTPMLGGCIIWGAPLTCIPGWCRRKTKWILYWINLVCYEFLKWCITHYPIFLNCWLLNRLRRQSNMVPCWGNSAISDFWVQFLSSIIKFKKCDWLFISFSHITHTHTYIHSYCISVHVRVQDCSIYHRLRLRDWHTGLYRGWIDWWCSSTLSAGNQWLDCSLAMKHFLYMRETEYLLSNIYIASKVQETNFSLLDKWHGLTLYFHSFKYTNTFSVQHLSPRLSQGQQSAWPLGPATEHTPAEGSAATCSLPPGDCSAHTAGERNQIFTKQNHFRPR